MAANAKAHGSFDGHTRELAAAKTPDEPVGASPDEDGAPGAEPGGRNGAVPDIGDDEEPLEPVDPEIEREAKRRALTARLRHLVQQRRDQGHPLPPSLVAWLAAPEPSDEDPGAREDPIAEGEPVTD